MAGKRILIVEDDPALCFVLAKALSEAGYEAKTAGDAIQGLALARQFQPELVMLDFMCPGGGGKAVHKALRLSAHSAQVPIVILSAARETIIMKEIDYDGATYYLPKPFKRGELLDVLRQALTPGHAAG